MINCPFCDAEVDDSANFCGVCGADLSALQPSEDPWLGRVVGGRYTVTEHIGSGGMGEVYLATHTQVGQKVAIKFLSQRLTGDPEIIRRFFNEARTIGKVNHPGAVTLNDFGQHDDGSLYIIMEYIEGQSLGDLVEERGRLELSLALNIVLQLCDVLDAAHAQDIVHRDLKPDNIMVVPSRKGRFHVKVLDFGIAKLLTEESGLTQTGMVFGTPDFMSPEQATGEATDGRADLYCASLILYYLLVGEPPFEATNPMSVLNAQVNDTPPLPSEKNPEAEVPPALEAVIMKALNKRPEERYGSISEFADALEELAGAEGLALSGAVAPLPRKGAYKKAEKRDVTPTAKHDSSPAVPSKPAPTPAAEPADHASIAPASEGVELDPSAYAIGDDIDGYAIRAARRSRPRTGIFLALGLVVALLVVGGIAWIGSGNDDPPAPEVAAAADTGPEEAAPTPAPDAAIAAAEPDAPVAEAPRKTPRKRPATKAPADKPKDEPKDEPKDKPAEPAEPPRDKPAEPEDKPDEPDDKTEDKGTAPPRTLGGKAAPADKPKDKPAEKPKDKPVEPPKDKTPPKEADKPDDKPKGKGGLPPRTID